ncbi:MAG: hypothetical protein GNW80_12300 [Asgard group archaeon]|nr:hypothetical protein [Asgard group archaeon]
MKIKDFFLGNFSHEFWKNRVSPLIIIEFLGTLMIAWALRPVWLGEEWIYFPFKFHISGLGNGRMEGNIGAWIFVLGFCLLPLLGTVWSNFIYKQFAKISKVFAVILWIHLEFSMICVAFVGIFDGIWPTQKISGFMHSFGATFSFLGFTIAAVLVFIVMLIIFWKIPSESRQVLHQVMFFLVIVELVGVYIIFRIIGTAFWQWTLMLSLMLFIFIISRFFPENLISHENKKDETLEILPE